MLITHQVKAEAPTRGARLNPPAEPCPTTVEPLDTFETFQGVSSAVTYKLQKMKAKLARKISSPLSDQPKVGLKKPLVCVQGFRSKPGGFRPLLDHLTEGGRNGGAPYYVQGGKFFHDPECETQVGSDELDGGKKIFRVVPFNREQSFEVKADQLVKEMEAITQLTGEKEPDVLAHSMGGLSVRRYLDKNPVRLGKVMMLGTPHKGTKNADFARKVLAHNVGWALSIGGISQIAAPAVEALRAVDAEEGANPFLDQMNERWPQQEAKTEGALTIGGAGYTTPTHHDENGYGDGDALIETSALKLPGAKVKVMDGGGTKLHHTLPTDPEIFSEMISFFDWAAEK